MENLHSCNQLLGFRATTVTNLVPIVALHVIGLIDDDNRDTHGQMSIETTLHSDKARCNISLAISKLSRFILISFTNTGLSV